MLEQEFTMTAIFCLSKFAFMQREQTNETVLYD